MWFLLMLIVFFTNGMSSFGLKVIADWGLPEASKFPYLSIWYGAGLLVIGIPMALKGVWPQRRELLWGAALAALSIGGQVAMSMALDLKVPGHIVFPVAIGGSVFFVALVGTLAFREKMNLITAAGVLCGFVAVVMLSLS